MPKDKSTQKKREDALPMLMERFEDSQKFIKDNYEEKWTNYKNLYRNKRVKQNYVGTADVFVPMVWSTIQTISTGLLSDRPRFDYSLAASAIDGEELEELVARAQRNPEVAQEFLTKGIEIDDSDIKLINELVDTYWEQDFWDGKINSWVTSMLVIGTSFLYLTWDKDRPRLLNIPAENIIIDPTATSPSDVKYYGRKYLTTVEDLESYEVIDPETGEAKKRYSNLDKVPTGKAAKDQLGATAIKDMFGGSTLKKATDRQVEVIEIWDEYRLYSVANRSVVIEDEENPTLTRAKTLGREDPKGILPFVPLRNYAEEAVFHGISEIDPIIDEQEMLNDLTNQNIDAISLTLDPGWHLDPKFADRAGEIARGPGVVHMFPKEALRSADAPTVPLNAFNERINIKNEIRETTASNQIVKGVGQGDGDITATEAQLQVAQAGQRFSTKIRELESDGFRRLATILLEFMSLYVTKPLLVKRTAGDGKKVSMLDPAVFSKEISVSVQLEAGAKFKEAQARQTALAAYTLLREDPDINQVPMKQNILPKAVDGIDKEALRELINEDAQNAGLGAAV